LSLYFQQKQKLFYRKTAFYNSPWLCEVCIVTVAGDLWKSFEKHVQEFCKCR